MRKVKGLRSVVVDTTATAEFKVKGGAAPDRKAIEAAISPRGVKTLAKVKRPKKTAIWEVKVKGFA